jgi:hypothetical protein
LKEDSSEDNPQQNQRDASQALFKLGNLERQLLKGRLGHQYSPGKWMWPHHESYLQQSTMAACAPPTMREYDYQSVMAPFRQRKSGYLTLSIE